MRYLIPATVGAFLVVSIFCNDFNFFTGNNSPVWVSIVVSGSAFLASFLAGFLLQAGVNKENPGVATIGALLLFFTSAMIIIFFCWWNSILTEHLAIVLVVVLVVSFCASVAVRYFGNTLRVARNISIFSYLTVHTVMMPEGWLPAVVVLAMIAGTFIAIPAANLADK